LFRSVPISYAGITRIRCKGASQPRIHREAPLRNIYNISEDERACQAFFGFFRAARSVQVLVEFVNGCCSYPHNETTGLRRMDM